MNNLMAKFKNQMKEKDAVKEDARLENKLATVEKKLKIKLKKMEKSVGSIVVWINVKIWKEQVRRNLTNVAKNCFWRAANSQTVDQAVRSDEVLMLFPNRDYFNSMEIRNWRQLDDAVFDAALWQSFVLNQRETLQAFLAMKRDSMFLEDPLNVYFSEKLGIKPPIVGALRAARDMKKGALATAKNLAQRAKDKIVDMRERAKDKKYLLDRINEFRGELSGFYNRFKDETDCLPPNFEDIFSELKRFLNDGKRGAKDLNFDNFVKSYCKKLSHEEINRGTALVINAGCYVRRNLAWEEQFKSKSDGEKLNKKIDKVKRFHEFRFKCNFFAKLKKFYEECKLQYCTYLSISSMFDLYEKFDYKNLRGEFPQDVVKLYGLPGYDKYHKELLEKVEKDRLTAKLVVIQEYYQTTDETFNRDLVMFEKCREKTNKFLDSMYKYACEHNVFPSKIPKSRADKIEALFDNMTERLTAMRDNWKNLS